MIEDRRVGSTRFKVNLVVEGRIPATPITGILLDVSLTGCLLQTLMNEAIAEGDTIRLIVSDVMTFSGQIAWCAGVRCGVRFGRPISNAELVTIRRYSDDKARTKITLSDSFGRSLPGLVASRKRGKADA